MRLISDILLTCNPDDQHEDYKEYPCLIIEVLSPATEPTDHREKLLAYQSIPSLKEYILVAQDTMNIEIYRRNGEQWQHITLDSSDTLQLDCLEFDMAMRDVYEDVFP